MTLNPQSCPVCEAELASVQLTTSAGAIRVGTRCARMLEQLARLLGADPKRQPALRVLE